MYSSSTTLISSPLGIALLAVLVLLTIGLFALMVAVLRMNTRLQYLTHPVYDEIVKEANEKAERILAEAERQGRAIQAVAEEEASKLLNDRTQESEQLRSAYQKQLEDLGTRGAAALAAQNDATSAQTKRIADAAAEHLTALEAAFRNERERLASALDAATKQLTQSFTELETAAHGEQQTFAQTTRARLLDAVEKEIAAATEAVTAYRQSRIELVERDIVRLVTETTRIALGTTLSLDEHRDLVLQALANAKQAGVFTT
ncbi:MAG: hypothetical protein B7X04_04075 [Parcubacteria group bacterium 21-54-25]|nr:MAG: hypothetical protein B7X04_04075 [Parcubacteria group bacterium 21-54-25]HQU08243.1 hypothetical protein [Candidatus Paceibacterota bacterium]